MWFQQQEELLTLFKPFRFKFACINQEKSINKQGSHYSVHISCLVHEGIDHYENQVLIHITREQHAHDKN